MKASTTRRIQGGILAALAAPFLLTGAFTASASPAPQPRPTPPGTQQFLDKIGLNPDDYRGHGAPDNSRPCAVYADSYAAVDSIPGGMC